MPIKKIVITLVVLFIVIPFFAIAATFQSGSTSTVAQGQNIQGNLYIAGGNVSILGNVENGDLYAAGGNLTVAGNVSKDLVIAGGTVNVLGDVGDDMRIAGGNVTVDSKIAGELLAVGGQLNFTPVTEVGGMAKIGGGDITLDGTFNDGVEVDAGIVTINGKINGIAKITATEKLVVKQDAVINGDLNYSSPAEADISSEATISGKTNFQKIEIPKGVQKTVKADKAFSFLSIWWFVKFIVLFVAALIFSFLLKGKLLNLVKHTSSNFGRETLVGFVIFFLVPIAFIIALFSVILTLPALFGLTVYISLVIAASVYKPILIGSWAYKKINKAEEYQVNWKIILLGVFILQVLCYIPFIGWLFNLIVFLVSLGTLAHLFYRMVFKSN